MPPNFPPANGTGICGGGCGGGRRWQHCRHMLSGTAQRGHATRQWCVSQRGEAHPMRTRCRQWPRMSRRFLHSGEECNLSTTQALSSGTQTRRGKEGLSLGCAILRQPCLRLEAAQAAHAPQCFLLSNPHGVAVQGRTRHDDGEAVRHEGPRVAVPRLVLLHEACSWHDTM